VSEVFVLADSLSVLSADTGGVMKLWDAEHGTTRLSISGPVGHLCLAPNSQLAVSGDLHDTRLVALCLTSEAPTVGLKHDGTDGTAYTDGTASLVADGPDYKDVSAQ